MKQSLVWEILVQPVVLYLIYAFFKYATVWLSCNRTCSIKKNLGGKRDGPRWYLCCGGAKRRGGWCCGPCLQRCLKGHEIEMSDLKKEMQHERLNVTLNIFEEDTNDEIADHNKEHKLHMRTINEGPLLGDNGCFGGKWDNLIFHILLRGDLKMWNRASHFLLILFFYVFCFINCRQRCQQNLRTSLLFESYQLHHSFDHDDC